MNTFKTTAGVWLSPYSSADADSLQRATDLSDVHIWEEGYGPGKDYTLVGHAEVTVTIAKRETIIAGKADALRAELAKDRADSQQRQNALIRKISELEALTFDAEAA